MPPLTNRNRCQRLMPRLVAMVRSLRRKEGRVAASFKLTHASGSLPPEETPGAAEGGSRRRLSRQQAAHQRDYRQHQEYEKGDASDLKGKPSDEVETKQRCKQ